MTVNWNPESDGTFLATIGTAEVAVYQNGLGTWGYAYGLDLRNPDLPQHDVPTGWPTSEQAKSAAEADLATTFVADQTVSCRSAADSECVWTFEVTRRTERMVTLRDVDSGEVVCVKVQDHGDGEYALPFGRYSMAPLVRPGRRP
jgi:hypothetical protein